MNGIQFLLAITTSISGLLLGFEMGVINVVLDTILILSFLLSLGGSLHCYSKKFTSSSIYPTVIEINKKYENKYFIPSYSIIGAFRGAVLASYFGKKFERHRNFIISF
ncbi:hypothetical protein PIROE2DRAFT_19178 [Piromyces sp. E2]|nr:hypothetical protein PIROE2DRAFT_19178 [Piromyces sp. E2]|eukprot:OUM56281.1 hypothetical protein PIROE2DRAFT_19178 [Piromyces sp. E2]